jgi:16S rRNA C1402 (ribose-2'-O) methylase RsmI
MIKLHGLLDFDFVRKRFDALGKEKRCGRCSKQIAIGHAPHPTWGYERRLCSACLKLIWDGIHEFEVTYKGGYSKMPLEIKGRLFVLLFDQRNTIFFKPAHKSDYTLKIGQEMLTGCKVMTKSEVSLTKTVATAGLARWKEQKYLHIEFKEEDKEESLIFDAGDRVEFAKNIINLIIQKKDAKKVD